MLCAVYFLRFDDYAGDPSRPRASARYYVGHAEDQHLPRRIRAHRQGRSGAALPTWFYRQGIGFRVVRVLWGADRNDERRIKQSGHFERYDPFRAKRLWQPPWLRRRNEAQLQANGSISSDTPQRPSTSAEGAKAPAAAGELLDLPF